MPDEQSTEKFLDDLEKEFMSANDANKAVIFELIANLDVHCRNCYVQQQNKKATIGPFGFSRWLKPKPYDLNISGAVTQMVGHGLSLGLSRDMRVAMENYGGRHITYKCDEAVALIHELYGRFSKHMTK